MIDFKLLKIEDRDTIKNYLKRHKPLVSELTFSNLFMWRGYYNFQYCIIDGFLYIIAIPNSGKPYSFAPVGNGPREHLVKSMKKVAAWFMDNGWEPVFRKVSEREMDVFSDFASDEKEVLFDRDNSDYIYDTQDLIRLKGKKFHSKRNHINRFKKTYSFNYERIEKDNINYCYDIMAEWCKGRNCGCMRGDYCERYANTELLDNYEALELKGALINVDGEYKAFTVGEMLNDDTAVIHIEKASFDIHGLYNMINQQFCENEWQDTKYINREQDLGQEGLRKAKLSYNPVRILEKFNIYLKI